MSVSIAAINGLRRSLILRRAAPQSSVILSRLISSSEKKPSVVVGHAPNTVIENPPRTEQDFIDDASKPRTWISYGYYEDDQQKDREFNAAMFFGIVTMSMVGASFVLGYLPDFKRADWGVREAYLELNRREKNGLPLIDREFVPLERIVLPTEEELAESKQRVYL